MDNTALKKRILVVEDELNLLDVLRDEFAQAGFLVDRAVNGEEGLTLALQNHPDLILADILMPKMDGITMLQKLHETEEGKKIPVVVLTNLNDAETVKKVLEYGAYDFLVKSDWEPKSLLGRVKEKLGMAS